MLEPATNPGDGRQSTSLAGAPPVDVPSSGTTYSGALTGSTFDRIGLGMIRGDAPLCLVHIENGIEDLCEDSKTASVSYSPGCV
jgi:hypothetical protein